MKTLSANINVNHIIEGLSMLAGLFFFVLGGLVALGVWEPTLNNVATAAFFGFSVALNSFAASRK